MPNELAGSQDATGTRTDRKAVQIDRANIGYIPAKRRVRILEMRLARAEADLARVEADAADLRARLHAFETSTFWRLTRPLRFVVEMLRPRRQPPPPCPVPVPKSEIPLSQYETWIQRAEAACRAELARKPVTGTPQLLGLVLWVPVGCGPALTRLLADCPSEYRILILDQNAAPPPELAAQERVLYVPVAPDSEPADAVAIALARLETDMLGFLDLRDRLAPDALPLMAHMAAQEPPPDLLFADEDWLDAEGRRVRPFFKPGWSRELHRGRDLVGPFAFFRTALVRLAAAPAGPAWLYDLASQVAAAAGPDRIVHVPAVLCHRTALPEGHAEAMQYAAAAQLRREGITARVRPHPTVPGWNHITYAQPQPAPLVSVIIPTRDRAEMLKTCTDGVLNATDYPNLELLIVDNGSVEPDALALLDTLAEEERVRVLRLPGSFNWSALNNAAAIEASGTIIVLLNNDIAVLRPDWLTILVSHAVQPGVGAVGAKLLYPDGRIQHAGLTTDRTGIPRHLFRHADDDTSDFFGLLGLAREVWGVTGACLALRRDVFFEVGALNESLPVANNDVDLCLRLTAHGYRIVWTPWSCLEHREMATRAPDHLGDRHFEMQAEMEEMKETWGTLIVRDPFLNPNLQLVGDDLHFRTPRSLAP